MTQIVPVQPGLSNVVASGPQFGVKFVLTGPDGTRIVFNDSADADYVGFLTDLTGLDSPDVREAADDLVGDDGGVHGNFFFGRRPLVLEGVIDNRAGSNDFKSVPSTALSAWLPTDITGCETWLAADNITGKNDGDAVGTWSDSSGNGKNGVQATGTKQPLYKTNILNSKPILRFDGTDDFMPVPGLTANDATRTVFIVAKAVNPSGTGEQRFWSLQGNSSALTASAAGGNPWAYLSNQAAGTTSLGGTSTTFGCATIRFNSTSSTDGFINGGAATNFDPDDTYSTGGQTFALGATTDGAALRLTGDIAEVIVYNTALSGTDLDTVRNYLGAKYGLGFGATPAQVLRTVSVQVPLDPNVVRNKRMTALQRATNAMRRDMQMRWAPEGGVDQILSVRRQQPLRITGKFNKTFQAALVAADPRIYSAAIQETRLTPNTPGVITNSGTAATPPVITIFGPTSGTMTTMDVQNVATGEYMVFAPAYALAPGQYIVIDIANKTVTRESGANIYDQIVFASSSWWQIQPGDNTITSHAAGTTTAASTVIRWQDAWV